MNRAFEHADRYALRVGSAGVALCIILALLPTFRASFFNAWLFAWLFWLSISLGGMALGMLHVLTGGGWGTLIRPIANAAARVLPLLFVLFVPVLLGLRVLFPWAPSDAITDPVTRHAHAYLNPTLFVVRWLVYFAVWVGLSRVMMNSDSEAWRMRASAAGLVLYVITITLGGVDWIMSRQHHFVSSIFGFVLTVSQVLTALCFIILVLRARITRPAIAAFAKPKHFVDLGNMLLMLVILWAYMNFAQFLIIWTGNEQTDIGWYVQRTYRGWRVVAGILIFVHFVIPLLLLLQRPLKANLDRLGALCAVLFALRILDLYWTVGPQRFTDPRTGFVLSPLDILAWIGIGGLWYAAFSRSLARAPDLELSGETDGAWQPTTEPRVA
jgi:hypothetical protein